MVVDDDSKMINIAIPSYKTYKEIEPMIKQIKKNTIIEHTIITSCHKTSASVNRNIVLDKCTSDLIIFIDDDITGFYKGWAYELQKTMIDNPDCIMCSARLLKENRTLNYMLCDEMGKKANHGDLVEIPQKELPTACIIIRKDDLRFDENLRGSGFDDNIYCIQLGLKYPEGKFLLNNTVKVIHMNEKKNQHGENWDYNKKYFDENFLKYRI